MKDKFYPHAILRHPSTSDEEVWRLIKSSLISLKRGGRVILLIEPALPWTRREGRLSHASWPVLGKRVAPTSR